MDMSLPQLKVNTGEDVVNTLYKLAAMKNQQATNQRAAEEAVSQNAYRQMLMRNIQSEIAAREAATPVTNALKQFELNEKKTQAESARYDRTIKFMGFINAQGSDPAKQETAYKDLHNALEEAGDPSANFMLPPEVFKDDKGNWDVKKYGRYHDSMLAASKATREKSGKIDYTVANPKFDPTQPSSLTNAPAIKIQGEIVNGQWQAYGEPEPTLDPFAVQKNKEEDTAARIKIAEKNAGSNAVRAGAAAAQANLAGMTVTYDDQGNATVIHKAKATATPVASDTPPGKTAKSKESASDRLSKLLGPGQQAKDVAPTSYQGLPVKKAHRDANGKIDAVMVEVVKDGKATLEQRPYK